MSLQTSTGAAMVDSTFTDANVVTPSDVIDTTHRLRNVRGIWADVAGTVSVITQADADAALATGQALTAAKAVSFTLPAGTVLTLSVAYVLATGTAATGIKAFA